MKKKKQGSWCRMFRAQCHLMLQQKGFWIAFGILLLFNVGYYLDSIRTALGQDLYAVYVPSDQFSLAYWREGMAVVPIILPFLVVLPVAFAACGEEQCASSMYGVIRGGKVQYYTAKAAAAFLGGGLIVWLPFGLQILWNCLTFHGAGTWYDGALYSARRMGVEGIRWLTLYQLHPIAHQLLSVTVLGVFSGACSVFACSVALYIRKYKILCMLPVFLVSFITRSLQITGFVLDDYMEWPGSVQSMAGETLVIAGFLAAGGVFLALYIRKKEFV